MNRIQEHKDERPLLAWEYRMFGVTPNARFLSQNRKPVPKMKKATRRISPGGLKLGYWLTRRVKASKGKSPRK